MGEEQGGSEWNAILQFAIEHVFANDELIDPIELNTLRKLALADGVVDAQERMVLTEVFRRVEGLADLDPNVRHEIQRFRSQHGIEK